MSNSTLKYIGKRLVISLITLFVILMVLFLMVKFLPGSPINNEKLSASARAAIEAQYGLDQPIPVQFVRYIQNMLTGDFGGIFNLYKDMASIFTCRKCCKIIYDLRFMCSNYWNSYWYVLRSICCIT